MEHLEVLLRVPEQMGAMEQLEVLALGLEQVAATLYVQV
jgi:hypothetical protein